MAVLNIQKICEYWRVLWKRVLNLIELMDQHKGVKQYVVTEPYLKISCLLGEGPFWEESTRCLRFVDIDRHEIHIVHPDQGPSSHRLLKKFDMSVGHTADIENNPNSFVFGGKAGFGIFHREPGAYQYIAKFWEDDPDGATKELTMRANDGGVDGRGRYWLGTMNDPPVKQPGPVGTVFRLDPDLSLHRMIEHISIPNGFSWSRDNKILYITDTLVRTIYAYDYDLDTGNITNKREFFKPEGPIGNPDGSVMDQEGCLWSAIYGQGKVVRISPEGEIIAEILLPTRSITCPVFVDDWIYITSAQESDPEKFPESAKNQGALFRCRVGVKGSQVHRFRYNGQ